MPSTHTFHLLPASEAHRATPVTVVDAAGLDRWRQDAGEAARAWVAANGFKPTLGAHLPIPDEAGQITAVLAGFGTPEDRARRRFGLAGIVGALPEGTYRLDGIDDAEALAEATLGWLLASYRFSANDMDTQGARKLVCPESLDAARLETIARGEGLTRDLINTPANQMTPAALETAARDLAERHGASISVITGAALLDASFPLIHTVGRASATPPRLIEISHGDTGPALCLVGKGVTFDTGGLNLKPGGSMALMKKDMGGAATVLGLAEMILATRMPIRLRVLIPAVENAVSGDAFRPGDILTARNGLTVEINNTDAEGRLVLADALALAAETPPDLLVSMATLTGAARVAVGPDIAPYFTDDAAFAGALESAAQEVRDPVWRLPFHAPYEADIEPGIADLDNAPGGGMAGSITAALFLRRFTGGARYAHFDIYAWQKANAPARPKGGVGQGARALFEALPRSLGL